MKCTVCGLEMELHQSIIKDGQLVKHYRCSCGNEQAEFINRAEKPKEEPKKVSKE